MVVTYFGGNSLRFQSGELVLLTDPANNRQKADMVLRTTVSSKEIPPSAPGEIWSAGEYEVKGIEILGIPLAGEPAAPALKTAYLVTWEGITIGLLGHLSKLPDKGTLEPFTDVDLLVVPTGDAGTLSPDAAAKIVKQLSPAIVVPSLYKRPHDLPGALGRKVQPQEKLVFKKKDIEHEKLEVVVLEAKGLA
jgi:L-ascorbate metabolism protein UlaG (beta-lactamase superfamily)